MPTPWLRRRVDRPLEMVISTRANEIGRERGKPLINYLPPRGKRFQHHVRSHPCITQPLFIPRGVPGHIGSDNGPEFVAKAVQDWITADTRGSSPWKNASSSFIARHCDAL